MKGSLLGFAALLGLLATQLSAEGSLIWEPPQSIEEAGSSSIEIVAPWDLEILLAKNVVETAAIQGIAITGTYSSADRHGIEGLAVINGELKSERYQDWDGVLLIGTYGNQLYQGIYHQSAVEFGGESYDLTDESGQGRSELIEIAKRERASFIQGHLLITNGALDVRPVEDAPKAVRRILFQNDEGWFGIYETSVPMTLYDASAELFEKYEPDMALNLDMGSYNFCRKWSSPELIVENCGDPTTDRGFGALTNLIVLEYFYPG